MYEFDYTVIGKDNYTTQWVLSEVATSEEREIIAAMNEAAAVVAALETMEEVGAAAEVSARFVALLVSLLRLMLLITAL